MSGSGGSSSGGSASCDDKDKPGARPSVDLASNPSTSSSSSGNPSAARKSDAGVYGPRSHSGELPRSPSHSSPAAGHRRSGSGTISSPSPSFLPAGNICPSGKLTGMAARPASSRSNVLGRGTGVYGHGSVVRGVRWDADAAAEDVVQRALSSGDVEEVNKAANDLYKKSKFVDALRLYSRAIMLCPRNAFCRNNRAAAFIALGKLAEALADCKEAISIDPTYVKVHQRLVSLYFRLGQVENARSHFFLAGGRLDSAELQKFIAAETQMAKCLEAREKKDWKAALTERDALFSLGVDSSPMLDALKAEALLRLHQLDDAELAISSGCMLDTSLQYCSKNKVFGMRPTSYIDIVQAQIEMASGRFENAVAIAERAVKIDPSREVSGILSTLRLVARARSRGNVLFNSGNYEEACLAYGEGIKSDPINHVLLCNRAACRAKLGEWEWSIEDCNEALRIKPNYTKALLRRATSYGKIGLWAESVLDYEVLRKQNPDDKEIADDLADALLKLRTCSSTSPKSSTINVASEVEEITTLKKFKESIAFSGVCVVQFSTAIDGQCTEIMPFVHDLSKRYPSVNFLKVDIRDVPAVADAENVRTTPTFKIYKNGFRMNEMVCPSKLLLEDSLKHYVI